MVATGTREDAPEIWAKVDELVPPHAVGPYTMDTLIELNDKLGDVLPSGTIAEVTTFMNSLTATVWVLGIAEPIIRTTVVEKGIVL